MRKKLVATFGLLTAGMWSGAILFGDTSHWSAALQTLNVFGSGIMTGNFIGFLLFGIGDR